MAEHTRQTVTERMLHEQVLAFVRAFGLHRADQTPCGQPVSVAVAYALLDLATAAPLSQNDLAQRLRLEKSTVSRLVVALERREWITRDRNPHDSRVVELRLTESGRRMAGELAAARHAKFARILARLPVDQHGAVLHALQLLVEASYDTP